jgi:hypothetical protein
MAERRGRSVIPGGGDPGHAVCPCGRARDTGACTLYDTDGWQPAWLPLIRCVVRLGRLSTRRIRLRGVPSLMTLPEFPQIDLPKRRRRSPRRRTVRPFPGPRLRPAGGRAVCEVASRTKPDIWYTVYIGGRRNAVLRLPGLRPPAAAPRRRVQAPARPARRARLRRGDARRRQCHPDPAIGGRAQPAPLFHH